MSLESKDLDPQAAMVLFAVSSPSKCAKHVSAMSCMSSAILGSVAILNSVGTAPKVINCQRIVAAISCHAVGARKACRPAKASCLLSKLPCLHISNRLYTKSGLLDNSDMKWVLNAASGPSEPSVCP